MWNIIKVFLEMTTFKEIKKKTWDNFGGMGVVFLFKGKEFSSLAWPLEASFVP